MPPPQFQVVHLLLWLLSVLAYVSISEPLFDESDVLFHKSNAPLDESDALFDGSDELDANIPLDIGEWPDLNETVEHVLTERADGEGKGEGEGEGEGDGEGEGGGDEPAWIVPEPKGPTREPTECGTWTIDCAQGAGACNNACFWHYCLKKWDDEATYQDLGPQPKYTKKKGGPESPEKIRNRVFSGVTTGGKDSKPPCRNMPLVQRYYDAVMTEKLWDSYNGPNLQADEWPMAAMIQEDLTSNDNTWPPRNSIRCIPSSQNGAIGNSYRDWRNGKGDWNSEKTRKNPKGGKWKDERLCTGEMHKGDRFKVHFKTDDVDNKEENVPYCIEEKRKEMDCANDGFEFYMSRYTPTGDTVTPGHTRWGLSPGRLEFPYDSERNNQYKIVHADRPADEYKIVVDRTGEAKNHLKATVSKIQDKKEVIIGQGEENVDQDSSMTIESDSKMPQPLQITNTGSCGLTFKYGSSDQPSSAFAWGTSDQGWNTDFSKTFPENQSKKPWLKEKQGKTEVDVRNPAFESAGAYCRTVALMSESKPGAGKGNGKEPAAAEPPKEIGLKTTCWFPGG